LTTCPERGAVLSFETTAINLGSGATDIVDGGLIVHRNPDDFKSQPTGNAGPRLACAIIVKTMPGSMNCQYKSRTAQFIPSSKNHLGVSLVV
jgi:hypothetical protein